MDGRKRSFPFHKVGTLLVLSCLPGGGGVLVLAGNTHNYSPGRLWLPIFRAGGMNISSQDIFLLVGMMRSFSCSILVVQLDVLIAPPFLLAL